MMKLTITRIDNGYILTGRFGDNLQDSRIVIEDDENDLLKSHEELLWSIIEYFGFRGSKHDSERLVIVRKKHE